MTKETKERIEKEAGALNVSDHFSLLTFGAEAQNQLNDLSRSAASLMVETQSAGTDDLIMKMISRIEETDYRPRDGWFSAHRDEKRQSSYRKLMHDISLDAVQLQKDMTMLMQDASILERLKDSMTDCYAELDAYVQAGQRRLEELERDGSDTQETMEWKKRFRDRLQNLETTRTITLQGIAQIKLMLANDRKMTDHLQGVLTETIPLWRSQIAAQIETDRVEASIDTQQKLTKKMRKSVRTGQKALKKSQKTDSRKAEQCNQQLEKAMLELSGMIKELKSCQDAFPDILRKMSFEQQTGQ